MFKMHSSQFSQATKGVASGILTAGVALLCFGGLIIALPAIFIFIAAGFFFLIGMSVVGYAIRLFLTAHRMDKANGVGGDRENVQIHDPSEHVS
jgi:hypothetical protein